MFLRNWFAYKNWAINNTTTTSTTTGIKYDNSVVKTPYAASVNNSTVGATECKATITNKCLFSNTSVMIGVGTTNPSISDYKLSAPTVSASRTVTMSRTFDENRQKNIILYTITGIASENMTITEIGLYKIFKNLNNVDETDYVYLTRTLLSNPITLVAGQSYIINYEVSE